MRNKYGAVKTTIDGITFDSKAEGLHYLLLKDRQRKGEIAALQLQPKTELIVNGAKVGTYTADFAYWEGDQIVVEDTKGVKARDFAIRSKLFMALYPDIELRVNGVAAKRPKAPKSEPGEDGWIVRRNLAKPPKRTKSAKEWTS